MPERSGEEWRSEGGEVPVRDGAHGATVAGTRCRLPVPEGSGEGGRDGWGVVPLLEGSGEGRMDGWGVVPVPEGRGDPVPAGMDGWMDGGVVPVLGGRTERGPAALGHRGRGGA